MRNLEPGSAPELRQPPPPDQEDLNGKLIGDEIVPGGDTRFDGVGVYVWSDRGGTTVVFDDVIVREMKENG